MQKAITLSDLRSEYLSGRMERKTLEGLIFQYLLNNFDWHRLFNGEKERWVDFLGWFYPRLSRAVDCYKERQANFDTYISTIVQWSSKEYKIREAEHKATEYVFWKARAEELQACCHEPEYPEEISLDIPVENTGLRFLSREEALGKKPSPEETAIKTCIAQAKISPKQILFLVLKSYYFMTDDYLNRIAEIARIEKKELQNLIDKLHEMRSKREAHIRDLQERIYSQYYRCLAFEKRLSSTYEGTAKHVKLTHCLDNARKRFQSMKERLSLVRVDATNQQIATLLNIPKGTVDSALHNIREKWKSANVRGNLAEIAGVNAS
jgi:hypothetical protein